MNKHEQAINIDLSAAADIECEKCESIRFTPVFIIKHISALMSPNGKATMVPLQLFKCDKCDHINELFLEGLTN